MVEEEIESTEVVTEEVEESKGDEHDCPYDSERCPSGGMCARCEADIFAQEVTKLVYGGSANAEINDAMLLAELDILISDARKARSESAQLKADVGKAKIEIDRLTVRLTQQSSMKGAAAEVVVKASQALSQLQAAYGDDLNWDNIAERANGTVRRLQAQAPLVQAAEGELRRMRERLAQLEKENEAFRGDTEKTIEDMTSPCADPWNRASLNPSACRPSGEGLIGARLMSLEQDLQFFRIVGRLASRLLGVDSSPGKR